MFDVAGSLAMNVVGPRLLAGFGRGWPGGQLLSLLVQRKLTKESTPRFAALRVPNFSATVRAAAQLALRAQTVLADDSRTPAEKLAAQRGLNDTPVVHHADHSVVAGCFANGLFLNPLQPEPRFRGEAGGCRRALSEPERRVAQPPGLDTKSRGFDGCGACFLWLAFFARAKKVTGRRAAPGQTPSNQPHSSKFLATRKVTKCPTTKTP
jgi:hypothetical protein